MDSVLVIKTLLQILSERSARCGDGEVVEEREGERRACRYLKKIIS